MTTVSFKRMGFVCLAALLPLLAACGAPAKTNRDWDNYSYGRRYPIDNDANYSLPSNTGCLESEFGC